MSALGSISTGLDNMGRPELVVNPTPWFRKNANRMTPLVVNEAGFFSKSFQAALAATGRWESEKELDGQRIDSYAEIPCQGGVWLDLQSLCEWISTSSSPASELPALFARMHGAYVQRAFFEQQGLPWELRSAARQHWNHQVVKVGVEFETGNVASSFRSLLKLGLLFRLGKIDLGVLVTSNTKRDASALIWPPSNRNGSFEELTQRRWSEVVDFPILGLGFAPDRTDFNAPVLRADGNHARVLSTGGSVVMNGRVYHEWQCPGVNELWYS